MNTLVVIGGPTASGKTALAVHLAQTLNTVVFSADSRQFYTEMSIGTARPTEEEQHGIPHFFIGTHSIHNELTASTYANEALSELNRQFEKNNTIILVGGSGLYIDALCDGLDEIPRCQNTRDQLTEEWKQHGLQPILRELGEKDADILATIDQSNPMRVIRALEVVRLTGKPFSQWKTNAPQKRPFKVKRLVIDIPREILYERINQRVDEMFSAGLVDEAHSLYPFKQLTVLNTVGYRELFDYFDGSCTLDEAIDRIKMNSRRYAKRQLTWFRRHPDAIWVDPTDYEGILNTLQSPK